MTILAGARFLTIAVALLVPVICQVRDADLRNGSRIQLKGIGLALHNYHDVSSLFPPGAIVGADGKPYHSWMTMILPYVASSPLYASIDFDRPWDDPRNITAFQQEYHWYLNPSVAERFDTRGFALSHYAGSSHVFGDNTSTKLADISDGTAQTIMAGEEAGNYTAWGFPRNWRDPAQGINSGPDAFGRPTGDGAIFLFADGHAQFLSNSIDPKLLQALSTPAGGEPLPDGILERDAKR